MQGHFKPHTEEAKHKCSEAQKLRWKNGCYNNRKLDYAVIAKKTSITQINNSLRGKNHPRWKGGVKRSQNSLEMRIWRKSVFERDDYTCLMCNTRGGYLHAHHIKPYSTFPEVRYDIGNGITTCMKCHYQLHNLLASIRRKIKWE